MNAATEATLAEIRRAPGRLLLTGLAITVAVLFAAGTQVLGDTMAAHLARAGVQTPAAAALVVDPVDDGTSGVSGPTAGGQLTVAGTPAADLIAAVRGVDGVAGIGERWTAEPAVRGGGTGSTWELRSVPLDGPLGRVLGAPLAGRLPTAPDEVAVGAATAGRLGLQPGDRVTQSETGGATRPALVVGVLDLPGELRNTAIGVPETVFALGARLTGIDVLAAPGVDPAGLVDRVRAAVGGTGEVQLGAERRAEEAISASDSVTAVLLGIQVFAGLAVVAAGVIVASTFRIVLSRRRTQLALLRCVGAGRGRLAWSVVVEAALCGLVAGLLGIGIAVGLGYGVLAAVRGGAGAGVAGQLLPGRPDQLPDLVLDPVALGVLLLVAVLTTVLASAGPALLASRVSPLAALGTAGAGETGVPRARPRLLAAGALLVPAGATAAWAVTGGGAQVGLVLLAGSGLVVFAALVVAGPVLARGLGRVLARPVTRVGGAAGELAVANAADVPRRTAATMAVLALGVGLTSALLVALESTRVDLDRTLDDLFPAELVVSVPDAQLQGDLVAGLAADPRLVVSERDGRVLVDPASGIASDTARDVVLTAVGTSGSVEFVGDVRAEADAQLDMARMLGLGMVGITGVVALVGVGVTLTLSVIERTRETGLLRAIGLTRRGVRAMVAWEAAMAGLGAALVGALVGGGYGLLGTLALGVGAGLQASSWPLLAGLVGGVVLAAVLAAALPAARAGRVPPIRALQAG